jgi:hypothetical protein
VIRATPSGRVRIGLIGSSAGAGTALASDAAKIVAPINRRIMQSHL